MGSDSTLPVATAPAAATDHDRIAQRRFLDDLAALELRLALIDDRFERLATRPDGVYRAFRDDTLGRLRSIAAGAAQLERVGLLARGHRERAAAVCVIARHRVARLDARRARKIN